MDKQNLVRLGTHDGNFHGDDVLAMAILSTLYPYHQIIRSRDPDLLDLCDILVDVGGHYDHHGKRYDHHLHNPPLDKNKHVLSSAGLIWRHYSTDYLTAIGIPKSFDYQQKTIHLMNEIDRNINTHWIVPIDRLDNGVTQGFTAISEVVRAMRPTDPQKTEASFNQAFLDTVSMVAHLFKRACFHSADHIIAKTKCMMGKKTLLEEGQIVISEYPVHSIKAYVDSVVHFVIYPSFEYKDSDAGFVIRLIQNADKEYRTPFPESVLGLRSDAIKQVLNIDGISYVHHAGFMALADTEENAITLCRKLLTFSSE